MAGKQPQLSIVIPAFGEAQRIGTTLSELAAYLRTDDYFKNMTVEVLVVAAKAHDATPNIAAAKGKLFRNFQLLLPGAKVGKGRDVQFGVLRAKGKFVVFMDADLATPLYHLQEFYKACQHADVVIGTRNLLTYRHSLLQGLFAGLGNSLYRITGGAQVEDTQCGFKMFTSAAAQLCFGRLTVMDWGFDMELLAIIRANKLRLTAIRIDDWHDMPDSTHAENAWQVLFRTTAQHLQITAKYLRGLYK